MRLREYVTDVAPKIISYNLKKNGVPIKVNPLTITFSVTAACRSLCKTCNIGRVYLENPERVNDDLSLSEIKDIFKNLGEIYFFNVSGGEPFMRLDLPEILKLAFIYLKPKLISIPTNSLAPKQIEKATLKILEYMKEYAPKHITLSIKPSIDGVGEMHDYIRGIKGNFVRLQETIDRLQEIQKTNANLHIDLGTVISNYNLKHLPELESWVHQRGIESYRHEIAEQRVEFHNLGDPITPSATIYTQLTKAFSNKIIENIKGKRVHTKITESLRITYYELASAILKKKKQVIPCFGGVSNIHLDYNGELWPCCILGGEQSMGNIRDWNYDMQALLASKKARQVIQYIHEKNCACPLASQWLNNVLLSPSQMMKTLSILLWRFPFKRTEDIKEHFLYRENKRNAIVLSKAGTIPSAEDVEAKVLEKNDDAFLTIATQKVDKVFKVHDVEVLTEDYFMLTIDRHNIEFTPGQYFILGKDKNSTGREYTVFSGSLNNTLQFLIRKVAGGEVSTYLASLKKGDSLHVEGPLGYFVAKKTKNKKYFIATGAGISPFHSIVATYKNLDYKIIHGVRTMNEVVKMDKFLNDNYIVCTSQDTSGHFYGRTTKYIKTIDFNPEDEFYICGNIDMLYEVYDILLKEKGISNKKIFAEVFY